MAFMEPTTQELEGMKTVQDLCEYADLEDAGELADNPRLSFLKVLGAKPTAKTMLVANISKDAWDIAMNRWQINGEAPSPIQLSSAGMVGITARLAAGITPTQAKAAELREHEVTMKNKEIEHEIARAASTSIVPHGSAANGLIKMSNIIDQGPVRRPRDLGALWPPHAAQAQALRLVAWRRRRAAPDPVLRAATPRGLDLGLRGL